MTNQDDQAKGKAKPIWAAALLAVLFLLSLPDDAVAQWTSSGNSVFLSNNANNVGVGTATPFGKLHVWGGYVTSGLTQGVANSFYMNANGTAPNAGQLVFGDGTGWKFHFGTTLSSGNFAERLTIVDNGNIGIGTPSPFAKLDIRGDSTFGFPTPGPARGTLQITPTSNTAGNTAAITFGANDENGSVHTDAQAGIYVQSAGAYGTKMYLATTDNFVFGAKARMMIDHLGNVGIGTTNPSQQLHIHSGGNWAGTRVTTAATGLTINDGVNFGYDNDYGAYVWNREATPVIVSTSNLERMRIDAAGNVGIGTSAPAAKFHISGPTTGFGSGLKMTNTEPGGKTFSLYPTVSTLYIADENAGLVRVAIDANGRVGIGTTSPSSTLHVVGDLTVTGNIAAKYQDLAEWVPASHAIPVGTVVVVDAEQSNHVLASSRAYDTRVAGVVSVNPGVLLGEGGDGKVMVATTGRVRVKVDATNAPIRVGDLLVTSDKEGIAMRSQPLDLGGTPIHRPGTLIGKALEPLAKGVGEILVLLSLQ